MVAVLWPPADPGPALPALRHEAARLLRPRVRCSTRRQFQQQCPRCSCQSANVAGDEPSISGRVSAPSNTTNSPASTGFPDLGSNGAPVDTIASGFLDRKDHGKFVQFFRMASAYVVGHRGRVFVVVVPGEVMCEKKYLASFLEDVNLLHGLGVRLVIVLGAQRQIDMQLARLGAQPRYHGGYRVTDAQAMQAAVEASGSLRMEVEAALSKALSVPVVRRHSRGGEGEYHYGPSLTVVSGNYVTGKRRGIVDGVDFGSTGTVRFVQAAAVRAQLELGHIVLLSNLAYSAAGEALNCNAYDIATHAAIELAADKFIVLTVDEVQHLGLPKWLSLKDADELLLTHLNKLSAEGGESARACHFTGPDMPSREVFVDLDCWDALAFPNGAMAACMACKHGVKRAHLVDARTDGGLLLELYSRDGVGTMISTDFYEGIRPARLGDVGAIAQLLAPLEAAGICRHRSRSELTTDIRLFTVLERETKVLGCALLQELGESPDGVKCAELAAFCVHPSFRGSGRGDSLLDYVEQDARDKGVRRLVLLTTQTADWFEQRDFVAAGPAHESQLIPERRRAIINPARNSKLFTKALFDLEGEQLPAGKRIGF